MFVSEPIFQVLFSKMSPFSRKKNAWFSGIKHICCLTIDRWAKRTSMAPQIFPIKKAKFLLLWFGHSCWIFMNIYQSWLQGIWAEMENSESVGMRQSKGTRRGGEEEETKNAWMTMSVFARVWICKGKTQLTHPLNSTLHYSGHDPVSLLLGVLCPEAGMLHNDVRFSPKYWTNPCVSLLNV